MTDVLNKLLIVLRRRGRRAQWTHVMHILTRAWNAFAQIIDLLLNQIGHGRVLVVEFHAFIYQFTFQSVFIGYLHSFLINFIYSGINVCYSQFGLIKFVGNL